MRLDIALLLLPLAAAAPPAPTPAPPRYSIAELALPGGGADGIGMDVIAYDPRTGFLWVPAGNTGAVDVVDTATGKITQVTGFATRTAEFRGRTRTVGPSAATVGDGVVYVVNRGDTSVCALDAKVPAKGRCATLDSSPDLLAYVAKTQEVWVTTPRDHSIRILDAASLAQKAKLTFEGDPEGLAVDAAGGRIYSNLEDKDRTVAIDIASHLTASTWSPGCGEGGPHGLALDEEAGLLFVACDARAVAMDVRHGGAVTSTAATGDGVDDITYAPATHLLYVGAARSASLTVLRADAAGHLTVDATVATRDGARNAVVTRDGTVYLAHGGGVKSSALVVATPSR